MIANNMTGDYHGLESYFVERLMEIVSNLPKRKTPIGNRTEFILV